MNYRSCKRSSASGNPLIIQPSNWSDLEHVVSWLHPGARMQLRWRNRFYALAKRLDMAGTEYITEKGPDNASLTYTAAKRGIRITMVVAWERILPHQITSIFASVAWGRGPIPVEPDESEVPFVLPRKPLAASRRFEASGAPQRLGQVPAELGPTLDEGWCSFQTTLYRSEDFTLVRQRYGVWSGKRGPLMARFFKGEVDLQSVQERVEALALPERVYFVQLPSWQVDSLFLKRFVLWVVAAVALFQVGALVYALLS